MKESTKRRKKSIWVIKEAQGKGWILDRMYQILTLVRGDLMQC